VRSAPLSCKIIARPAKGFDLSWREEALNQRLPIAVEPFADHRFTGSVR
jgi:hypothetical protein